MKKRLIVLLIVLVGTMAVAPAQLLAQNQNGNTNRQNADKAVQEAAQTLEKSGIKPKLFKGFGAGIDLFGPGYKMVADEGDYQAYLVANIKGTYFPVIEVGRGVADKYNEDTYVTYKSRGTFGRIGCDYNILNKKTDPYRLTLGLRYGMSKFNYDTTMPTDSTHTAFSTTSEKCTLHWMEIVLGVNAKIWGPVHMGWSLRYRRRLKCSEYIYDPQYAPGYGNAASLVQFMGTYTIGIEF